RPEVDNADTTQGALGIARQRFAPALGRKAYWQFSNKPAAPWPPPMHMVTTPYFPPRSLNWLARVPVWREPVMPKGWPIEMEPPLMFSFSGSMPNLSPQ